MAYTRTKLDQNVVSMYVRTYIHTCICNALNSGHLHKGFVVHCICTMSSCLHKYMHIMHMYMYVHSDYVVFYSPVTFSVTLSVAVTAGLALITASHSYSLPSSSVLNCETV